jgi:hypothetical protein
MDIRERVRACLDDVVFEIILSQNCGFIRQRDMKLQFRKKRL